MTHKKRLPINNIKKIQKTHEWLWDTLILHLNLQCYLDNSKHLCGTRHSRTREMSKIVFLFSMSLYFSRRSKINIWVHKRQTGITQCLISNMKFDGVEKKKINVVWNWELFNVDVHILWAIYKRGCRNLHSFLCMPLARMGETIAIKYMFLIVFSWAKYVFIKTNLIKYFNNQMFWKHCRDVKRKKKVGGCHMIWYFVFILLTEIEKNHDAHAFKICQYFEFYCRCLKTLLSFKFQKVMHMF